MKEFVYYNDLFDIYSNLLTDKEISTFKDYYQEDLSLSEIADDREISRSAVQKTIKTVLEKLDNYEDKLRIYEKNSILKDLLDYDDMDLIKEKIIKALNV